MLLLLAAAIGVVHYTLFVIAIGGLLTFGSLIRQHVAMKRRDGRSDQDATT